MPAFKIDPPTPATNAELIEAIEGYRQQLDDWSQRTSANLRWLSEKLQARLDAVQK